MATRTDKYKDACDCNDHVWIRSCDSKLSFGKVIVFTCANCVSVKVIQITEHYFRNGEHAQWTTETIVEGEE